MRLEPDMMNLICKAIRHSGTGDPARGSEWCQAYSYSGRGMYGQQCLAVGLAQGLSSAMFMVDLACWLHEYHPDELQDVLTRLRRCREDSMGLGTVLYWPDIEFTPADADEVAEDYDEEDEE